MNWQNYERVDNFKYFWTRITSKNNLKLDVGDKTVAGNSWYDLSMEPSHGTQARKL